MVGEMTLEEKVSLTGGVRSTNGCAGTIPGIRRLDFPGMCLHDAGQGVRNADFVNAYPAGIHVGARYVDSAVALACFSRAGGERLM